MTRLQVKHAPSFYDPARDGITFSLLNSFKNCRELTRLGLKGVTPKKEGLAMVFGGCIHWMLDQVYRDVQFGRLKKPPNVQYLQKKLDEVTELWKKEHPFADVYTRESFELTTTLAEPLLRFYFKHWRDDFSRKWTKLEHEFKVPIVVEDVPNLGTVKSFIRGKMDGVFVSDHNRSRLFETKTKSRMDDGTLVDILPFELQLNIYMWALWKLEKRRPVGVLYNLIRRPGLRIRRDELMSVFAERIVADIQHRPDWYFVRMEMDTTEQEMVRFEGELVDLVRDFLAWWYGKAGHWKNSDYCQNKYGSCWALSICSHRNYHGTFKRDRVFRELAEEL